MERCVDEGRIDGACARDVAARRDTHCRRDVCAVCLHDVGTDHTTRRCEWRCEQSLVLRRSVVGSQSRRCNRSVWRRSACRHQSLHLTSRSMDTFRRTWHCTFRRQCSFQSVYLYFVFVKNNNNNNDCSSLIMIKAWRIVDVPMFGAPHAILVARHAPVLEALRALQVIYIAICCCLIIFNTESCRRIRRQLRA